MFLLLQRSLSMDPWKRIVEHYFLHNRGQSAEHHPFLVPRSLERYPRCTSSYICCCTSVTSHLCSFVAPQSGDVEALILGITLFHPSRPWGRQEVLSNPEPWNPSQGPKIRLPQKLQRAGEWTPCREWTWTSKKREKACDWQKKSTCFLHPSIRPLKSKWCHIAFPETSHVSEQPFVLP